MAAGSHEQPMLPTSAPAEAPPPPSRRRRALTCLAHNMHYVTFLPLIIMSVLQDLHLVLAALLNTGLVATLLVLGFFLFRGGYIKVYPKPYDLFNLALYGSMVPLALCAHDWLLHYVSLLTNGGNAVFMWATILLPFTDNFVMHSVRDRVPEAVVRLPMLRRMALLVAVTWAVALTLMTAGAIIPLAMRVPPKESSALNILSSYVLGFGPLLLAFPIQFAITTYYRKRMMRLRDHDLQRQQQQREGQDQQDHQQQQQQHWQDGTTTVTVVPAAAAAAADKAVDNVGRAAAGGAGDRSNAAAAPDAKAAGDQLV